MATAESAQLGRPVWYELITSDPAAAEAFYTKVVGWTSAPFKESPSPYTLFKRSGDVGVAGLMKTPDGMHMPPFWGIYLVPDVDAAVDRVTANGGQILNGPMEVPGGDRVLNAMDPQGAAFSLHSKKKS